MINGFFVISFQWGLQIGSSLVSTVFLDSLTPVEYFQPSDKGAACFEEVKGFR